MDEECEPECDRKGDEMKQRIPGHDPSLSAGIVVRLQSDCKLLLELGCAARARLIEWPIMPKRSAPKRPVGAAKDLRARIRELEDENRRLRTRLEGIPGSRLLPLGEIAEEFNTLDLDRISKVATQRISALVSARLCSLFLYDYETQELVLAAHTHPRPLPERISLKAHRHSVMNLVLATRKTVEIHGFHAWEAAHRTRLDRSFASQYETENCLSVPLLTANYVVGVLNLADKEGGAFFDAVAEVPAVEHLA